MKRYSPTISKYLLSNILPYFIFVWLLLSVILFVQQSSRYSDIFFSVNIPKSLIWQLMFALVPNVIAFTAPMAILLGIIIGLTKMLGDSELTAIRAAGVGNLQIILPILLLGLLLSIFAFFINLRGVPIAAKIVRGIALQTALYKLESPIEPGVFNTEIGGYTIYVKTGDKIDGEWKNIFIYREDKDKNELRLITAKSGKVDSTIINDRENAELVLQNAVSTTLPLNLKVDFKGKTTSENIGEIRFSIKTKRDDIVKKLTQNQAMPEEMGLDDLAKLSNSEDQNERIEGQILWQRRLLLSITPLIFALLGTVLVLRYNRGGRSFGIMLALLCLIVYYLVALFGEQLARVGKIYAPISGLLPLLVSGAAIIWFSFSSRFLRQNIFGRIKNNLNFNFSSNRGKIARSGFYFDLTTGIRDFDIIRNLLKYFFLALGFLTSIYLIFTTFEMWRFVGGATDGVSLLSKYLFYLVPYIYLQLAPSAVMIATLVTFIIKSRQNEVVAWTAAGQSIYRLLAPCFLLMMLIGVLNWLIQENLAPRTNQKQDIIRSQIRNKGNLTLNEGKYWVANDNYIYSFEKADKLSGTNRKVENLTVFEFSSENQRLTSIYKSPTAIWQTNEIHLQNAEQTILKNDNSLTSQRFEDLELKDNENPFNNLNQKTSHLSAEETKAQMLETDSETEKRNLLIALQKKYTTPFLPFLIVLFTAPFALSLSRKSNVITIGYAVGLWLVYMGISNGFEQIGLAGGLFPRLAVWTPMAVFSLIGIYLFSRVKT